MLGYCWIVFSSVVGCLSGILWLLLDAHNKISTDKRKIKANEGWTSYILGTLISAFAVYDLFHVNPNWIAAVVISIWLSRTIVGVVKKSKGFLLTNGEVVATILISITHIVLATIYVIFYR